MSRLASLLAGLQGPAVLAVIGALVFSEAAVFAGLLIPGETALLVAGALAARGAVPLALVLVVGAAAAVAGDSVGYLVGARFGPRLERSRLGRWVGPDRWERARDSVRRRGAWAVVLGRWIGVLRALVPAVVGNARMRYRRFLVANAVGGVTWAVVVVLLGYALGGSLTLVERVVGRVTWAAFAFLLIAAAFVVVRRRRHAGRATDRDRLPTPGPADVDRDGRDRTGSTGGVG